LIYARYSLLDLPLAQEQYLELGSQNTSPERCKLPSNSL
jgi:hypothetical protein